MNLVTAVLKNGETRVGPLWTWRPRDGWFELAGEELSIILLSDVQSAIEKGVWVSKDRIEDVDLLKRARTEGWTG